MARLLSRLRDFGIAGLPSSLLTWSQRVCEQIEAQFGSQQSQIDAINAALAAAQAAQASATEYMPDIAPVVITADYTGAVEPAEQLPHTVNCKRYNNTTNVTTSSTWSSAVISGGITQSIDPATGALTITAITGNAAVEVTSVRTVNGNSITLKKTLSVSLNASTAPVVASSGGGAAGSGGTTQTDNSFSSFSSTSMATVTDLLSVTVGAAGQVALSAPLTVLTDRAAPAGTFPVFGVWQWDSTGAGVWVDLGTEVQSSPDCDVAQDSDTGIYGVDQGTLTVSQTKTGLTVGSIQKFRLRARNSSGTRTMSLSGTASAVGS